MMVNDLRRRSCKRLKLSKYVALDTYTYLYIPLYIYTHTYAEKTMRKCQSVLLFLIVAQVPVKVPQTSQCRRQFAVV